MTDGEVVVGRALSLTVVTGDGPGQEHGKVPVQSSALCTETLAPGQELCWNTASAAHSIIVKPWGMSHHRSAPRYGLRRCLRCLSMGCTASGEPDVTRAVGEGFVRDRQQGRCEDALLKCNSVTGTRTVFLHTQLK